MNKTIVTKFNSKFVLTSTRIEEYSNTGEADDFGGYDQRLYRYVFLSDVRKGFAKEGKGEVADYGKRWAGTQIPLYYVNDNGTINKSNTFVERTEGGRRVSIGCQEFVGPNARAIIEAVDKRASAAAAAKAARKNRR